MNKQILAGLAIISFILNVCAAPISAQGLPGSVSGYVSRRLSKLSDALDLSFLQKARICPILIQAHRQSQSIKADTSLVLTVRKSKMRELIRDTRRQIEAVLTPEQREKLKAMRQVHHKVVRPVLSHAPTSSH